MFFLDSYPEGLGFEVHAHFARVRGEEDVTPTVEAQYKQETKRGRIPKKGKTNKPASKLLASLTKRV